MSGFKAGNGAAKSLIRLRVILAGEGVVREERGLFRATLPGAGYMVDIDDRAGTSKMIHRSGSPMGPRMDLSKEPDFATFMHTVDSCMASRGRIPVCLLGLADEYARVCAEGDMALASIVSDGNVELGTGAEKWVPGPAFRGLAEAACWTKDKDLSDVAEESVRLANGKVKTTAVFSETVSQHRWLDLIERWASRDAASFEVGDSTWTEIKTRSGLLSASIRIERNLGAILSDEDGKRLAFDKVASYVLVDQNGIVQAVGVLNDDHLAMHTASSSGPLDEEEAGLRFQVCSPSSPRP